MTPQPQFLDKPLPSSESAERTLLGAILVSGELIAQAAETLKPEDFYSPLHRHVFAAMMSLFEKSKPIDPIMISEETKLLGITLESFGGIAAVTNLCYGLPHFEDISEYVATVAKKAKLRLLIKNCSEIMATALDESDEAEKIFDFAQSSINEVCADSSQKGFEQVGEVSLKSFHEKLALRESGVRFTGLETGFDAIDNTMGGLHLPDLVVLAARPRMGKTSLVIGITENICEKNPAAVIPVFSLEMSKRQLAERMICSRAQVSMTTYRNALFNNPEAQRISEAIRRQMEYKIEIDDTPALSPAQIRAKSMMLKAKHGRLDLIVVDFLQKMSPSRRAESVRLEVGQNARELKNLAKDLNVPVLVISSLNRECEKRPDKKPIMSDLSESNIIESEADIICFLHRAHVYSPEANPYNAELIIEKNRHGEEGTKELKWIGEFTQFTNK